MRKRTPPARSLVLLLTAVVMGLCCLFFPLRAPQAKPAGSSKSAAKQPAGESSETAAKSSGTAKHEAPEHEAAEPVAEQKVAASQGSTEALATAPTEAKEADLTRIPVGRGLPVKVNVGVFFVELLAFDDTNGNYEATTDLRLQWTDRRLEFDAKERVRGFKEYLGKEAEEQLAKMWVPTVHVPNRIEGSLHEYVGRRLRIYPNGEVETLARETAGYKGHFNPESFPFDRQLLQVDLVVRDATTDEVSFRFDRDDVDFSRASRKAHLDGWTVGWVRLEAGSISGWNGDRYGRTTASLAIDRRWVTSLAPIFIPLLASLLIPLLAIWMNRAEGDGFAVDAFELANMGIGGLFSVIALSFAIYSSYGVIANSDNTVTRLFALNYAMLAITLVIVVVCFRFNLLSRLFGQYFQQEAFKFLLWSLPLLSLATSLAFMLVAAA